MQSSRTSLTVFTLVGLLAVSGGLEAGDSGFQGNLGDSFFQTTSPCPLKEFPTFEAIVPIPNIIDPFDDDIIPLFCQIRAKKKGNPVNKAKGTFSSELYVLHNTTGMFEVIDLGSGKFKTGEEGIDSFELEIPAPLFADGFESGDVSAWSYTRADFTKKKGDTAEMLCNSSGNK